MILRERPARASTYHRSVPAPAQTAHIARLYLTTLEARDWEAWTALLADGVVYDLPQTRELVRGRENFLAFNTTYPGDWHLEEKILVADEARAVLWVGWRSGEDSGEAQIFLEVGPDGLVTRVTDFWPEPYDPPRRPDAVVVERY